MKTIKDIIVREGNRIITFLRNDLIFIKSFTLKEAEGYGYNLYLYIDNLEDLTLPLLENFVSEIPLDNSDILETAVSVPAEYQKDFNFITIHFRTQESEDKKYFILKTDKEKLGLTEDSKTIAVFRYESDAKSFKKKGGYIIEKKIG